IVKQAGFGELVGPIWRLGDARFGVVVEARHLNFADIVHGGLLATLADQAMGMTALRATGNKPHATIELNMQFVVAVRLGEFVEAQAKWCGSSARSSSCSASSSLARGPSPPRLAFGR